MFNLGKSPDKKRAAAGPMASRLGAGSRWLGDFTAGAESLSIEGSVEGSVQSEGHVEIAPGGVVKGTILARHLTVRGRMEGAVTVTGCLEILGAGHVEGEVELDTLVVDEGATLEGRCHRRAEEDERKPAAQPQRKEEVRAEREPQPVGKPPVPLPDYAHAARSFERPRF